MVLSENSRWGKAYDGTCIKEEDILGEPLPEGQCRGKGPFRVADTCSCEMGSVRTLNADATQFKCVKCDVGMTADPNVWGECVGVDDADLKRRILECESTGMSRWNETTSKCEIEKSGGNSQCPTDGPFLVIGANKNCTCKDGYEPAVNATTNMGECSRIDPNLVAKQDGGGCSLNTNSNGATPFVFIIFVLMIVRRRKAFNIN